MPEVLPQIPNLGTAVIPPPPSLAKGPSPSNNNTGNQAPQVQPQVPQVPLVNIMYDPVNNAPRVLDERGFPIFLNQGDQIPLPQPPASSGVTNNNGQGNDAPPQPPASIGVTYNNGRGGKTQVVKPGDNGYRRGERRDGEGDNRHDERRYRDKRRDRGSKGNREKRGDGNYDGREGRDNVEYEKVQVDNIIEDKENDPPSGRAKKIKKDEEYWESIELQTDPMDWDGYFKYDRTYWWFFVREQVDWLPIEVIKVLINLTNVNAVNLSMYRNRVIQHPLITRYRLMLMGRHIEMDRFMCSLDNFFLFLSEAKEFESQ
jgi:hypothetical protein